MRLTSISVVVPTYNDAAHVGEALDSIATQSRAPDEIVVADDCSTDDTRSVVQAAAERHPAVPIRYLRLDSRGGVVGARNHGTHAASGEWIANCDSDDIWLPGKLERQAEYIAAWEGSPLAILGTYGYNVNDGGQIVSPVTMGPASVEEYHAIKERVGLFYLLHSSILFPKAVFESVGGYTEEYGTADDIDFWTRMADQGVVLALPETFVHYRKRSGSIQFGKFADKREGRARLRANRRREALGEPPLSVDEFRVTQAAAPLRQRMRRRRRALGGYHWRMGAAFMVNGKRLRGVYHLLMAGILDQRRVSVGLRSVLSHRFSSTADGVPGSPALAENGSEPAHGSGNGTPPVGASRSS
jgi:glycosyltransferase involved in cell wall biosynthesis